MLRPCASVSVTVLLPVYGVLVTPRCNTTVLGAIRRGCKCVCKETDAAIQNAETEAYPARSPYAIHKPRTQSGDVSLVTRKLISRFARRDPVRRHVCPCHIPNVGRSENLPTFGSPTSRHPAAHSQAAQPLNPPPLSTRPQSRLTPGRGSGPARRQWPQPSPRG